MPNPKLATLVDAFTAPAINAALWSNITGGAATLDTVNDVVVLTVPTVSGNVNTFGSNTLFDATASQVFAQVDVAANGNGGTKSIMRIRLDANNAMTMRVESGVFKQVQVSGGSTTSITLPSYDPHAHRWWRLRESAGTFYADASPDGLNWTNLSSMAYTWDATAITLRFESQASVTEVAGSVTGISHVNTRLGGQFNPNWPDMRDEWAPFWGTSGGSFPLDRFVDVSARTRGSASASRGRQYETDQVRSGTYGAQLANTDAALDPTNASGPYAGKVLPYQPYRKRGQWPPTRNMLTQVQATGGDLGGYALGAISISSTGPSILSDTDSAHGSFVTSATAWQGGTVAQFAVLSTATATQWICYTAQPSVLPGQAYTVQLRVRNVTASTSVQVAAGFRANSAANTAVTTAVGSTATLAGSATAAWTTITVTGTAAANAAMQFVGVQVVTAPGSTCSVQVDGWQLETGSTATSWTAPGVWYPVVGTFVEDWPSQWDMDGTYGTISPSTVDSFALLSQRTLDDPLTAEINQHSPRFLYKLDDPAGSLVAADSTGTNAPIPVTKGKYGPGVITFGTAVTATDTVNGEFTGSTGTVMHVQNVNPATNILAAASYLSLDSVGIKGPANVATGWTRCLAFRYTGPASRSQVSVMWSCFDNQRPSVGSLLEFVIVAAGTFQVWIGGPVPGSAVVCPNTFIAADDGNWHLAIVAYDGVADTLQVQVDATNNQYIHIASGGWLPTGLQSDSLGNYVDKTNGGGTTFNWAGDLSFAAEFPVAFSAADRSSLYTAWKSSCAGESTNARYARILRYAGYAGATSIQTGLTTSMGAANIGGQDAVTALQGVVDTEGGAHYVDRAGAVTFLSRSARYNALTPVYIFGERADLGEWPYEDCQADYDSTHLGNVITVTQEASGQQFTAQDAASIAAYFPRSLQRNINSSSTLECQDAANYLLSRTKQPATRISTLKLHPSANPAMWPVCLSLELGTRVRVMRRPPGVPAIQVECFVENIASTWDDTGEATVTLQCSPADLTNYGIYASWHTTLHTTVSSGVTSITVDASADTVNPLAAQLGQGQQLVLGQNTANQETVTILSVGTTSPGWTTAVITLQAATTKGHTAGDTVCDGPLPTGVTNPATWDNNVYDAVAYAY